MSATHRCDCCGTFTDKPVIEITRINGRGGAGVDVNPGQPHHFCHSCAVVIYSAVRVRRAELQAITPV